MSRLTPLRARIIEAGFAHNEYLLELNRCLEDPAPRYPTSRMFKWPVSIDSEDRLTVCHHLMTFEPFVMRVMMTLGVVCEIEPHPAGCHGIWQHAGDLATDSTFKHLIATAHYVTPSAIARGVTVGVMSRSLSPENARTLIASTLDAPEPSDRSAAALRHTGGVLSPAFIDDGCSSGKYTGKGKWAVNLWCHKNRYREAWAAVHGVEDGWFQKSKYGYHHMSISGMIRHMNGPAAP